MILLVRHASAGDRDRWVGDDGLRPLDERGLRQADELVSLLASYELDRVLSSPAVRCVQTVEPLSGVRGLAIEVHEGLSEQRQFSEGASLVRSLEGMNAALSCHGGLSELVCGESQKKGEVLVLRGATVVDRFRAKGR